MEDVDAALTDDDRVTAFLEQIEEPKARSLRQMYGIRRAGDPGLFTNADESNDPIIHRLRQLWESLDEATLLDGTMHKEQEREIAHEMERERQVQRPARAQALRHRLHPTVVHFVEMGAFPAEEGLSDGAIPAGKSLYQTTTMRYANGVSEPFCPQLWVTQDFAQTVAIRPGSMANEYMRAVQWVLTSFANDTALILSPYEANELLPRIQLSRKVRLHSYAARTMVSFADLAFDTITGIDAPFVPTEIMRRDLALFAGSLYLEDYARYAALCDHLGIVRDSRAVQGQQGTGGAVVRVTSDGFVDKANRLALGWPVHSPFTHSPLPYLKVLLSLRMKGDSFPQTHMGRLADGRVMDKVDFP